jgi:hypothetical protein
MLECEHNKLKGVYCRALNKKYSFERIDGIYGRRLLDTSVTCRGEGSEKVGDAEKPEAWGEGPPERETAGAAEEGSWIRSRRTVSQVSAFETPSGGLLVLLDRFVDCSSDTMKPYLSFGALLGRFETAP